MEVSDNGEDWAKRFYIGKNKNGIYVTETDKSVLTYWEFCRPIKEKVTYYVYREIKTGLLYTYNGKGGVGAQHCELIHSFTI